MFEIKVGQIYVVIKQGGILVLTESLEGIAPDICIGHDKKIFAKKMPFGDIFLCLEIIDAKNSKYNIKILWNDKVYYTVCDSYDVRTI